MIIRQSFFETNSSSTHALCIGKGGIKPINMLIREFKDGYNWKDSIEKEEKYLKLKKSIEDKRKSSWKNNRGNFITLRRFKNIGRMYDTFDTPESKLNFIWTCLVMQLNYSENIKDKKRIDVNDLVYKFLKYLYDKDFSIRFVDITFKENEVELKGDRWKVKNVILGKFGDWEFIPKCYINKYLYGEDTYGYVPLEEINVILNEPILFYNLVFGNSIIYTGSDEESSFEDLTFDHYSYKLVGGSDWGKCATENIFSYKKPKKIGSYINGNYKTTLYDDGTRTRELFPKEKFYDQCIFKKHEFYVSEEELMKPKFPESIDLKITDKCSNNCKFCYTGSNSEGLHAKLNNIKEILDEIHKYTEVAIGGGNPLEHPDLIKILEYAKDKDIICNITLKDIDIIKNIDLVNSLSNKKLVRSIGISPSSMKNLKEAIMGLNYSVDFVIHLVLGIHNKLTLRRLKEIKDKYRYFDKILFLGYKHIGRGNNYFDSNKDIVTNNINEIKVMKLDNLYEYANINNISFDNLALEQLEVNLHDYPEYYQGKDGKYSFYIDAVNLTYARSSIEEQKESYYSLIDSFNNLKEGV